jgi:hypothetical protein
MLNKYDFTGHPMLSINIYEYGTEFMNWNRLERFLNDLIPNYSTEISLPTYLLFDNEGNVLRIHNSAFEADKFKLE